MPADIARRVLGPEGNARQREPKEVAHQVANPVGAHHGESDLALMAMKVMRAG